MDERRYISMAWGITLGRGGRGLPKYKRRFNRKDRRKLNRTIRQSMKQQITEIEIDNRHRYSAKWNYL